MTRSELMRPQAKGIKAIWNSLKAGHQTRQERRACATLLAHTPAQLTSGTRSERRSLARATQVLSKRQSGLVKNWYEGGFPFLDGTRAWVPSIIQDARYDQNLVTRRESLRRNRYWSQNSGIWESTVNVSRQYTIGTHCPVVTSLSTNQAWAEMAETVFHELLQCAGLDGEDMLNLLNVAHDCHKSDGDVLFVETSKKRPYKIRRGTQYETEVPMNVPCYQLIEGHRIETPPSRWNDEGRTNQEGFLTVDGVQFQEITTKLPNGKTRKALNRVGYWVRDSQTGAQLNDPEAYTQIAVEHSCLIYTQRRVNQIRGLSDYIIGEPTLAMLEDLLKLEMRAQEVQSELSVFITNGAGQIVDQKTQATLGAVGIKLSKDNNGNPVVNTRDIERTQEVYKKIWGGNTFVGRTGDTLGFLAPNRPAEATLNLWNYLINLWCASARTARILVFPKAEKGQGTEVRAELDKANSGFIGEFNQKWKPFMQRAWKFFVGWAKDNDARLKNPPPDWDAVEISPPRSVLVDAGYDSAAMIAELAAGLTNLHIIAQRLGTTRKKLIAAAVSDVYLLKCECARISGQPTDDIVVTAEEVRQSLSDVVKNLAAAQTAAASKEREEALSNA